MTKLPFAATTPQHISKVGLRARDHEALSAYYRDLLGFREMRRAGTTIVLGAGDRELLEIEGSQSLKPDDPRSAGLYHTAFLLPSRRDLALWTRRATEQRYRIEGASDHEVSEAIYLTDPEGNGIEIYADRPREQWPRHDGVIQMGTRRLDFDSLMAELADSADVWDGAPDGSVIGHVHLRVGDIDAAERFWNEEVGLDTMVHYGNAAVFLSSGGYHHHIGANIWQSAKAGRRDDDRTGLAYVELKTDGSTGELEDPWGNVIRRR